jgi:hypothetical protein
LTETKESEPEIHALTVEAIKKAKVEQDCGLGSSLTEVVLGEDMMMNPGLGGPENRYGGKELDAEDYKALNTVTKNTLRMAGLDPDIDPVKNLSNANPIVKLYYADFYDPASDKLVTNAEESDVSGKLYEQLKDSLSEYGHVIELTEEGLKLEVDLTKTLKLLDDDFVQELFDQNFHRSDDRLSIIGAFWDIVNETNFYNKEKFDFDVYPNPSNKEVNESVRDYL